MQAYGEGALEEMRSQKERGGLENMEMLGTEDICHHMVRLELVIFIHICSLFATSKEGAPQV